MKSHNNNNNGDNDNIITSYFSGSGTAVDGVYVYVWTITFK